MVIISSVSKARPHIAELYSIWTGDEALRLKQAEQVAWSIEDQIARDHVPVGDRMCSEDDLAKRFGTGLGVAREALEILDLRGVCVAKRGPGGGIFVSEPSLPMTAQALTAYFLRIGVTEQHLAEAEKLLRTLPSGDARNPAVILFKKCVHHLRPWLGAKRSHDGGIVAGLAEQPVDTKTFQWRLYSRERISVAQRVGWAISEAITQGQYTGQNRIGSEEELCDQYAVSRSSMRQATRLLETFGIVESRPGPGRGLIPCKPSAFTMIRRIDSYLLALHMSGLHWRRAAQIFGESALECLMNAPDEAYDAFLVAGIGLLKDADIDSRLPIARNLLRSIIERSPNPIITLFWRGIAGYTFRAFNRDYDFDISNVADFPVRVPRIFEAARANDSEGTITAYNDIFSEKLAKAWTV